MSASVPTSSPAGPVRVIQGGMGVAVSSWRLASAVARAGQLGVVSGTALDLVLARRLQDGDRDGSCRRALAAFPVPEVAERVLHRYFRPEGRAPGAPYLPLPRLALRQARAMQELIVLGSFVEVWLAREGHGGRVGINFLEKVQMATPAAAFGAMVAGVDVVLMGAGVPREIPRMLDLLAAQEPVRLPVHVAGAAPGEHHVDLDPVALLGPLAVTRPDLLAIVSADVLAAYLARDPVIRPDGLVVEGPSAGGHNAPPRGRLVLDDRGQPVFGPRDAADVAKVAALGLPFWLAGSFGTPEALRAAEAAGACGVQVGSLFALSSDSGLSAELREDLLAQLAAGTLEVRTDPRASPTGFPFKVARLAGTLSEERVSADRPRLCDLGYLRTPFVREGGGIGYHCPSEPLATHARKGGAPEDAVGRACLCNALAANVGLGQTRSDGYVEKPLVTLGTDLEGPRRLAQARPGGWSAEDAVRWLLGDALVPAAG